MVSTIRIDNVCMHRRPFFEVQGQVISSWAQYIRRSECDVLGASNMVGQKVSGTGYKGCPHIYSYVHVWS